MRDKPVGLAVTGQAGLYANADPRRVRQVLTNLITNAIKATAQGWVTVHLEARGGFVAMVVQDTGAGIPPEERDAIFEAYRQARRPALAPGRHGPRPLHRAAPRRHARRHDRARERGGPRLDASPSACRAPRGPRPELMSRPDTTFPSGSWQSTTRDAVSDAALHFTRRVLVRQALTVAASFLVVAIFAPRLLVLEDDVAAGVLSAGVTIAALAVVTTAVMSLVALRRHRPLLRALAVGDADLGPADLGRLAELPVGAHQPRSSSRAR